MLSFDVWTELSDRKQYELYVEAWNIIRKYVDKTKEFVHKIEKSQNELGILREKEQEEHESGVDWDNKGEEKENKDIRKDIVKYEVSGDGIGLLGFFEDGTYYHIYSNELSKLEKWILNIFLGGK